MRYGLFNPFFVGYGDQNNPIDMPFTSILIQEEFLISSLTDSQYFESGSVGGGAVLSSVFGVNPILPDAIGAAFIGYDSTSEDVYIASKVGIPIGIGRGLILRCRVKSSTTDWNVLQVGFSDAIEIGAGQGLYFRITSQKFKTWSQGSVTDQSTSIEVTVTADTYYDLRIEINADATEVKYFVDDVLVETITNVTNIPKFDSNDNNFLRVWCYCISQNSNPVTLHRLDIDYINLEIQ
jgi:hypothetical protein